MFINDSCQLLYDLSGVLSQALDLKRTFRKGQVRGVYRYVALRILDAVYLQLLNFLLVRWGTHALRLVGSLVLWPVIEPRPLAV